MWIIPGECIRYGALLLLDLSMPGSIYCHLASNTKYWAVAQFGVLLPRAFSAEDRRLQCDLQLSQVLNGLRARGASTQVGHGLLGRLAVDQYSGQIRSVVGNGEAHAPGRVTLIQCLFPGFHGFTSAPDYYSLWRDESFLQGQ